MDQRNQCAHCGESMTTKSGENLMETISHSMCNGIEPSNPFFVKLMLHAIGVQIFGGFRFSCSECQELFSSCPRSYGCSASKAVSEEIGVHRCATSME